MSEQNVISCGGRKKGGREGGRREGGREGGRREGGGGRREGGRREGEREGEIISIFVVWDKTHSVGTTKLALDRPP